MRTPTTITKGRECIASRSINGTAGDAPSLLYPRLLRMESREAGSNEPKTNPEFV